MGDYGYCKTCGAEISLPRLEARPTADECIDYINRIKAIEKDLDIKLTKIGAITKKKGLKIKGLEKHCKSYQHF
jgi:RNA polymerase-binding transcription factor DksA